MKNDPVTQACTVPVAAKTRALDIGPATDATPPPRKSLENQVNDPILYTDEPDGESDFNASDLFKRRNYREDAEITELYGEPRQKLTVVDTGAGPNLVREAWLSPASLRLVQTGKLPTMLSASNEALSVTGVLRLRVQIGQLSALVWFAVVERFTVDILLGTSYIDRHIERICPMAGTMTPAQGGPVQIVQLGRDEQHSLLVFLLPDLPRESVTRTDHPPTSVGPVLTVADLEPSTDSTGLHCKECDHAVTVARKKLLPPNSETPVLVHCKVPGLSLLAPHPRLSRRNRIMMASGVMDVKKDVPFYVNVANFENYSVMLPRSALVGLVTHDLEAICTAANANRVPQPRPVTDRAQMVNVIDDPTPQATDEAEEKKEETPSTDWRTKVEVGEDIAEHRERILALLDEFKAMWDGHLGLIQAVTHNITLEPSSRPFHSAPYRAGPKMREHEKAEIDNMLKAGVIEPSSSEWASPIVFVPKKDGKLRFCVDYRKLNALTIRDSYPIPRMDECIDSLGDAGIFSTLDANSGYWQVEIHPEDKDKSAFSSHFGLFRFTRMPFGLRNAPATFQRVMDVILSSVRWQFALVYLDDVIIFSRSVEEHFAHVRTVLSLLQKAGVTLRIDKCCFFSATVDYLGHVIHPRRLAVSKRTCDAVSAFKPPKTATDIRSFVGLCNVFRRFIPNFAKIAAPLTAKLQKGQPTKFEELSDEEEKAFKSLKSKLVNPPILALPRSEGKFTLDTDACDTQVGCVLLQDQPDGHARPIGYWSRKLTKAEQAYTTTERECLAIV